jgi:hypothetical protein
MSDKKPEYLTKTDKQTIKEMDGEVDEQPRDGGKSPMEDAGSPGGTSGTGNTYHDQDR